MGVLITTVYHGRTTSFEVDTHHMPPLDASDPLTFDRWCATPAHDARTLEEFAAAGGARVGPPDCNVELWR